MNCKRINPRYMYFSTVLTMGVTVLPNGKALLLFCGPFVPTRSMITLVVSQKAAAHYVSNQQKSSQE